MDFNQIMAVAAAIVPAVAYVVTTMSFAKRNREDILRLETKMESRLDAFEHRLSIFEARLSTLEADVAVIKAICQERYKPV
ncbi:MAG: hypothetical protein LBU17_12910 [Treponema sp.]|jgi:hypothetical protein|nr:hypothetical protein [Treponema sp.]